MNGTLPKLRDLLGSTGSYAKQLKDTRWARRKTAYFATREKFCQSCKRTGIEIHLHHIVYAPGSSIWDAGDDDLIALCRDCHKRWHSLNLEFRRLASRMPVSELQVLVRTLGLLLGQMPARKVGFIFARLCCDPSACNRLERQWEDGQ